MKKVIFIFYLFVLHFNQSVKANHIFGAELFYKYLNTNQYKITLILYGDCASTSTAFQGLYGAHPKISIFKKSNGNYNVFGYLDLNSQQPEGIENTPVCTQQLSNTSCNGGSLPGIRKFVYENVVNLGAASSNIEFEFRFNGLQDIVNSNLITGRSLLITNIVQPSGSPAIMNLKAYLNRSLGENSSPNFTSTSTPFFCINKPQTFNINAVDSNGNNLTFSLVKGLTDSCQNTVNYVTGFSQTNPITTSSGIVFSPTSGQMSFTPSAVQNDLVVYQVNEFKNGTLIGTSMREMTFVILNNCNNTAAISNLQNNGSLALIDQAQNKITICKGKTMNIKINGTDPDNDNVNMSVTNLPLGATSTISNNNTNAPFININYVANTPGTYVFYITLTDNGCPISVKSNIAFTIEVIEVPTPIIISKTPTNCINKSKIEFSFPNITNYGPANLKIYNSSGTTTTSINNITSNWSDSFSVGNYSIDITNPSLSCSSNKLYFSVVDSGLFPYPPSFQSPINYCVNDVAIPIIATNTSPFSPTSISWFNASLTPIPNSPTPPTNVANTIKYYVNQKFKNCTSNIDTIIVKVSNIPIPNFSSPSTYCQYDTFLVNYTGTYKDSNSVKIVWNVGLGTIIDTPKFGQIRVVYSIPGTFQIKITSISEDGCFGNPISKPITILPSALVNIFADTAVCQYDIVDFSNTMPLFPNTVYTWNLADGTVISQNSNKAIARFDIPGLKTITLSANNGTCNYVKEFYLHVNPKPNLNLSLLPNTKICYGDTIKFTSSPYEKIDFSPSEIIRQVNDTTFYFTATYLYTVTAIVTAIGGCQDTAIARITSIEPCCNYSIPNAFSPNGDNFNDKFGLWFEGEPKYFKMRIYNRYGQEVFSTLRTDNYWDGTYNGKNCDIGTYFFMITGECFGGKEFFEKGEIILIK